MNCPRCGGKTAVIDSTPDFDSVYRRRKCLKCSHKFVTTELMGDYEASLKLSELRVEQRMGKGEKEKREIQRKGYHLVDILKLLVKWAGFEFIGDPSIKHTDSNEEFHL